MIFVEYDPFAMESRVGIINSDETREYIRVYSEVELLAEELVKIAYDKSIYDIKIHGPFGISSQVKKRIAEIENKTYSENKISIEGI